MFFFPFVVFFVEKTGKAFQSAKFCSLDILHLPFPPLKKKKPWKPALWCVDTISSGQGIMWTPISCILGLCILGRRRSRGGWEWGSPPHGAVSAVQVRHPWVRWGLTPPQDFSVTSLRGSLPTGLVGGSQLSYMRQQVPGKRLLCCDAYALCGSCPRCLCHLRKVDLGSKSA